MKDKISHVHSRAVPYATPRRALHPESGTFASRSVRQAIPNPACSLSKYLPAAGNQFEDCNEYIGTVECVPALRAFYVQSRDPQDPLNRSITCAKLACDLGLPNIRKADLIPVTYDGVRRAIPNDTRCFIAIPPEEFTYTSSGNVRSGTYRNIPGTGAYAVDSLVIMGSVYPGVIHDVDHSKCSEGLNDPAVAREIQQEIGITAAIGATAIASCVQASSGAAVAATQATAVTGLAVGLGLLGSGVVIGGAAYAGYKMVQHYKLKNEVAPSTELNERLI